MADDTAFEIEEIFEDQDNGEAFMLDCVTDIVSAYISNHQVERSELPALMREVHGALAGLQATGHAATPSRPPAVPIEDSVQEDYIVCLEDGHKLKMLKRYLRTQYQLSPEEYRAKWGLPADYPMVAPGYAKTRSKFAKQSGLGKKK